MHTRLLRLTVVGALFGAACSRSNNSDGSPGNLLIDPKVGYSSEPVAVSITGDGFLRKVTMPQGGGEAVIDTHHRAWIGDNELSGVTWQSTTRLDATVPRGIKEGAYDLIVENAMGDQGIAKGAYTVRPDPRLNG